MGKYTIDRRMQNLRGIDSMKIGYLGPVGTYCQEAVEKFMGAEKEYILIEFATIYDALSAVVNEQIECAMVPIENSIEGSVNVTLDLIAGNDKLKIKGEIIIPIIHNLLAKKGTELGNIKVVLSHPHALAQCQKYLREKLLNVETRFALSTADAAREVANSGLNNQAAIANKKAAEVYGLEVIAEGIQDERNNMTRFIMVGLNDSMIRTGYDKTSIIFSLEDRPGSLYRILDIFNLWDINLTKIESRPAKSQLGKYIFFVDLEGHREEQDVKDALTMVNRKTSFFRIIGSYPRWKLEIEG